ncbi:hypothetical protein JRO89_XS11G0212500 [Xanthoceras sorbifolium]|uniref:Hexosyltransferase n=1 Tax=Xanthoceras sorbifolium TaxID=99658 RepID=A0ABQ8HGJ3_9ROSI|nr:hypothetical protein JRO89_XS11G0212500 [Xanthoceras sorbifolium]
MHSKGSSTRLSSLVVKTRISSLLLSMFATFASIYVAGRGNFDVGGDRLWQDAQNRVHLIKELDRITGQGQSAISVDDTLKIIACREQRKKLSELEMELAAARQEGFSTKSLTDAKDENLNKRPLVVIGIITRFGRKNNRDAIRKAWMGTGDSRLLCGSHECLEGNYKDDSASKHSSLHVRLWRLKILLIIYDGNAMSTRVFTISGAALKKMEHDKGIIARFVIGRSANRGDNLDKAIDSEKKQTNDFVILDNHVEAPEELPKKAKLFFAHSADKWDAEFYVKVNDDVYVNIDTLGATLANHLDKPRVYIGCMKSGEVFSEPGHRWYEPDWWKFGDKKSYFRHASGEMYAISKALAKFISINRSILCSYAHDDELFVQEFDLIWLQQPERRL